jgi:thioredoxin-related protein
MAINVDLVYKTVLLILNQQQRGYITPDEFNKVGNQVQQGIFEKYMSDLNQQLRIPEMTTSMRTELKT